MDLYTNLFVSKYGKEDSGIWFDTLKDLTPRALEAGMERLLSLKAGDKFAEFPPNPLQFKEICTGYFKDMNLPSKHQAFVDIQNLAYRSSDKHLHPVVRFIARKLPDSFYRLEQRKEAWEQFSALYEKVSELLYQGHSLPPCPPPRHIKKERTDEVANLNLNQMRAILAGIKR